MDERPYKDFKYYELVGMANANADRLDVCKEILFELSFRKPKLGVVMLQEEVQAYIDALEKITTPFLHELLKVKGILTKDEIIEAFPDDMTNLRGFMVGATGGYPVTETAVRSLAFWQGAILGDCDIWQDGQLIVIGQTGFNEDYLKRAVELIVVQKPFFHFVSQEVFLNFLQTGNLQSHYPGDPRIVNHPGLNFLASVGFRWPVVGIYRGIHKLENFEGEDHDLAVKYGYSVRAGESIASRRRALTLGVSALGLQTVAYHIAGLIKRNSGNPVMKHAVPRWREDLAWLYQTKYLNSTHSFLWPLTDG